MFFDLVGPYSFSVKLSIIKIMKNVLIYHNINYLHKNMDGTDGAEACPAGRRGRQKIKVKRYKVEEKARARKQKRYNKIT